MQTAAKPVLPALLTVLRDRDATEAGQAVKWFILGIVPQIDPTSEALWTTLKYVAAYDASPDLQRHARAILTGLEALHSERDQALPRLLYMVQHGQGLERMGAVATLGQLGEAAQPAIPIFLNVLRRPEPTQEDYMTKAMILKVLPDIDLVSRDVRMTLEHVVKYDPAADLKRRADALLKQIEIDQ